MCRYDDYDAEYDAESYTQIVSEMSGARQAQEGYRTDRPHGQRGAHAPAHADAKEATPVGKRDFGSGIL